MLPKKEIYYKNILHDLENVENKDGHIAKESIAESVRRWNELSKSDFKCGYESALEDVELYLTKHNIQEVLKILKEIINE